MTGLLQDRLPSSAALDSSATREFPFLGTDRSLTDRLTALARRFIDDQDLAHDAVQEALLSFWLEDEIPPNPQAWLIRTVRNRCLHLSRGRSRRLKHETNARLMRHEASDRDDPAYQLECEEWARIFSRALDQLDSEQRTILVLSLIDELDYQSIALVLEIPIGTVRSRLSRARRALRDVLSRMLPNEVDAWQFRRRPVTSIRSPHARRIPSTRPAPAPIPA